MSRVSVCTTDRCYFVNPKKTMMEKDESVESGISKSCFGVLIPKFVNET
jgi:hypothetical protein